MKKSIFIMFFLLINLTYARAFEKIKTIERKIFGFTLEESGNFTKRLDVIEEKLFGEISVENDIKREKKLHDMLFINGNYYSPIRKIERIENFLFEKRNFEKDILTRVENIEEYIFHSIYNEESIIDRLNKIYSYLLLENEEFRNSKLFVSEVDKIKIAISKKDEKYKINDKIVFMLQEDITGVARAGSKVLGKIDDKDGFLFRNKKIKINFYRILSTEDEIIDIHGKKELQENRLDSEKAIEVQSVVIIG